jgi:hypothetical protein
MRHYFLFLLLISAHLCNAQTNQNCNEQANTCPFENAPIRYIAINIHFILSADGRGNFTETDDGDGGAYNGYQRAEDIVTEANEQLEQNTAVWGQNPAGPVCPINFRLFLKGVYFHRTNTPIATNDPLTFYPNQMWGYMANRMIHSESEMNCIFFEAAYGTGQSNSNHVFVHNMWSEYITGEKPTLGTPNPNYWFLGKSARVLLHESFHNNGLASHPFETDFCNDTPTMNPPCWDWNPDPNHPCHNGASNLIMDYNSNLNWSLSSCEICILNTKVQDRYIAQEGGTCPPVNAFFQMPVEVCPQSADFPIWMQASASANETSHFIEIMEVSDPISKSMVSGTYYSNWFPSQAGLMELRSYTDYPFNCLKYYQIKLAVSNTCGDWHEQSQLIYANCYCNPIIETASNTIHALQVSPNPATTQVTFYYTLSTDSRIDIRVHNLLNGAIIEMPQHQVLETAGEHQGSLNTGNYQPGLYVLKISSPENTLHQIFQILE